MAISALILAAWLALRLSQGPIDLDFLTPYIENALSTSDASVRLERTVLTRDNKNRDVDIRVTMARILTPDGAVAAVIPEMNMTLSFSALLRGAIAPRSLEMIEPALYLVRDTDGSLRLSAGGKPGAEPKDTDTDTDADAVRSSLPLTQERFLSYLDGTGDTPLTAEIRRIEIAGGTLTVEDRMIGRTWKAPRIDFVLRRNRAELVARLDLSVAGQDGLFAIKGDAHFPRHGGALSGTLLFSNLHPADFAEVDPSWAPLSALRVPFHGSITAEGSFQGLNRAQFSLTGDSGQIDLPATPDAPGATLPVRAIQAKGTVRMGEGGNSVSLDSFQLDLDGPVLNATARIDDFLNAPRFEASATLADLATNAVQGVWPAALAPDARDWVVTNLSDGKVSNASITLKGHVPSGAALDDAEIDELGGELSASGVTVQYLAPMPVVRNAAATAHFDMNAFTISVHAGELKGLKVREGTVILGGLSDPIPTADITLKIAGPVTDALTVVDSKPLGYATSLGIDPKVVKGDALTDLSIKFPLLKDLRLDDVGVKVAAETTGVAIPDILLGQDLAEGVLTLTVDTKGLDMSGKALLGGTPSDITWHENFSSKAAFTSRYTLKASLDDAARARIGLDSIPFQPPYMTGPTPVDVTAVMTAGGKGDITVKADLAQTAMALPDLNWVKEKGAPGQAQASIRIVKGALTEIPFFAAASPRGDLAVEGRVAFKSGRLSEIVLTKAQWNRSDLQGTVAFKPNGPVDLHFSGIFDARELISGAPTDPPAGWTPPIAAASDDQESTPLILSARFSQIWVANDGQLVNVDAEMSRRNALWRQVAINGRLAEGPAFSVSIAPAGAGRRKLNASAEDAGGVFRALDIFNDVVGGRLTLEGAFDDSAPHNPLKGMATIRDYRLVKAPALARLLTVAALTGALDVLSGSGIHFSTLIAPFTLTDGVIELSDARTSGTELGLTAKGQIDLTHDRLALEGTIVPLYAVNNALSRIPLIGGLFSAEKGGGIIAMNYSLKGPTSDPSVSVNPLSVLTPGFLRQFFDLFSNDSGTQVRPKEADPAPAGEDTLHPQIDKSLQP
ncbi:MAG: AsmA-like C-terminal domain-containing protein [Rhodospirillaceae bacterium]|nr:AsmA-like C-terminal domain-containing protein [Rhodospirillaceae bacterium]